MIISTTENIGKSYEVIGLVKGTTVNSKNIGKDIGASFKTIIGGEIKGYTEMINEAQDQAVARMAAVTTSAMIGSAMGNPSATAARPAMTPTETSASESVWFASAARTSLLRRLAKRRS